VRLPRTTGVLSGLLIVVLGAWAGLIPFVGPYFHYGFTPDQAWHYSSNRLWLDILPAGVAVIGGLMMILSTRRPTGALGGWLAIAGGGWLVVGPNVSLLWQSTPGIGAPLGGAHRQAIEWIGYFYGVGALIVGLAAFAVGRFLSRPHVAERAAAGATERREGRGAAAADTRSTTERAGATERQPVAERSAPARSRAGPEPAAEGGASQGAGTPSATGGTVASERQEAPEEPATAGAPPAGPRAQRPAAPPARGRRRQGGLVGRLLGRRSRS
jgi:hypothetical protein